MEYRGKKSFSGVPYCLQYGIQKIQLLYPLALYMDPREAYHIRITGRPAILLAPAAVITVFPQDPGQFPLSALSFFSL